MAISPNLGQAAARQVADYYLNAEVALLQRYAKYLTQGLTLTDWEQSKLAQLQALRNTAWNQLDAANKQAESAIRKVVDDAYQQGSLSAYQDASRYLPDVPWNAPARTAAVETIAKAATGAIESATVPLLGSADEKIRQAIAQAAGQTLTGAQFRKTATQAALNRAFESGLGSVPVGRGVMTLPDYVTMSVRTATTNAGVLGHAQTMQANGFNLCYIQPGPYPCDKCDAWIGKILSLDGSKGILTTTNLVTGESMTVHVAATLDEARAAGWGHPNCRCRLATYIPGVDLAVDRIPESRAVYEASQQQRALERQIRSWKYRQSIAITPRALSEANAAVAGYQARLRQLVRENPGLVRQYEREQTTGHYGPQAAPLVDTKRVFADVSNVKRGGSPIPELRLGEIQAGFVRKAPAGFLSNQPFSTAGTIDSGIRQAVKDYSAGTSFKDQFGTHVGNRDINYLLRNGKVDTRPLKPGFPLGETVHPSAGVVRSAIRKLDTATGVPFAKDVKLYRYTESSEFQRVLRPGQDMSSLVGREFQDTGFMSTTRDATAVGKEFTGLNVKMVIEAPAGTRGLALGDESLVAMEKEVLLARDTHFQVTSVSKAGKQWTVTVRVLPRATGPAPKLVGAAKAGPGGLEPTPSSPPGWKPVMSRAAAEEYMAGTKVRGTYYHGTNPEAYESIRTSGFDAALGGKNTNTALLGHGVYLSGIKEYADEYARYLPGGKPATVEVMVKAERPINILDILKNPDFKGGQFDMYDPDPGVADAISAFAKDHGYDAVYMQYDEFAGKLVRRGPITEIVVSDPKQIVVINDGA